MSTTPWSRRRSSRGARHNAVRAMIDMGLQVPERELVLELEAVISEFGSNYDHHLNKLLQRVPKETWLGINPALLISAGVVAYHDTKFQGLKPFPDVVPFLKALRDAGLQTGIVTHGLTTKQAEKLIRLGLIPHLGTNSIFISDQVGISKPNPRLYQRALEELHLTASKTMYVGDNPANDIQPCRTLGMRTTWARRAAKPGRGDESAAAVADQVVDDFRQLAGIQRSQDGVELDMA
jgi:putative hydrolase of the HAD superfamily